MRKAPLLMRLVFRTACALLNRWYDCMWDWDGREYLFRARRRT